MLKLSRDTKVKVLFLLLVFVFSFDLFKFSAAILEKGLFTKEECFETMSIANVRIHEERTIKRVKAWHIFDQVVPLSIHGCINRCGLWHH